MKNKNRYQVRVMMPSGREVKMSARAQSHESAKHLVCKSLGLTLNHALSAKMV